MDIFLPLRCIVSYITSQNKDYYILLMALFLYGPSRSPFLLAVVAALSCFLNLLLSFLQAYFFRFFICSIFSLVLSDYYLFTIID